jgi:hypothetical protein
LKGKSDGFKNSKKPQKVRNGKYEGWCFWPGRSETLRFERSRDNLSEKKNEKQNSPINGKKSAARSSALVNLRKPEKNKDIGKKQVS